MLRLIVLLIGLTPLPGATPFTLTWDADPSLPGAQGGQGTWDATAQNWLGASGNRVWDPTRVAVFGGLGGELRVVGEQCMIGLEAADGYAFIGDGLRLTGPSANLRCSGEVRFAQLLAEGRLVKQSEGVARIGTLPTTVMQVQSGAIVLDGVAGTWTGGELRCLGNPPVYTEELLRRGVHLRGGGELVLADVDLIAPGHGDAVVLGVHGSGTVLRWADGPDPRVPRWTADGSNAKTSIVLTDGGRLVLGAGTLVDGINAVGGDDPRPNFTRQLWMWGDGTGVLECEAGFAADQTRDGTVGEGIGSYRLNGVTLITRHDRNLPLAPRWGKAGGVMKNMPNGHLYFEDGIGNSPRNPARSTWRVVDAPQRYGSGIFFVCDGTIDTQADLDHVGQDRVWDDYTGHGAFMSKAAVTIVKTGSSRLRLAGAQRYIAGTVLRAEAGTLELATDPGQEARSLTLVGAGQGRIACATPRIGVAALRLEGRSQLVLAVAPDAAWTSVTVAETCALGPDGVVRLRLGVRDASDAVQIGGAASLGGTLHLDAGPGFAPALGDQWVLLRAGSLDGAFAAIQAPPLPAGQVWNYDITATTVTAWVATSP